jgi:CDP-diacylglycerol--glycerol-3-phosphate 3-phosphatidyltransferase
VTDVNAAGGNIPEGEVPHGAPHEGLVPVSDTNGYGPSAIATPANFVTVIRLLVSPLLFAMISDEPSGWFVWAFFSALAFTDGIDGWIARRYGTTRSGAFLDPLADKVVVLGALVALVAKGIIWWLPVAVIAVREIAMSVYRSVAGRHGISIPARNSAKFKTLVQDLAIGLCLAPPLAGHWTLLNGVMWVAAFLTVFTGAQYYVDGRRAAAERAATAGRAG